MSKRIKIGILNLHGDIYGDYEEHKVCNFCIHFKGIGFHYFCGDCTLKQKRIEGGYSGNFNKTAKECDCFNCKPELLKEEEL